jgi:hypothetical protein
MLCTRARSRVFAIVLLVIVIATSIALRKAIPSQPARMAIGIVEVVLIAILVLSIVRSR